MPRFPQLGKAFELVFFLSQPSSLASRLPLPQVCKCVPPLSNCGGRALQLGRVNNALLCFGVQSAELSAPLDAQSGESSFQGQQLFITAQK